MNKKRKIIQSEEAVSNIWISILLPLASVGITYVVAILIKSNGLKSTIQLLSFFVIVCAALLYIVIKIFVSANISKQEKILDEELVSSENAMLQKVNAVGFTGVFPEEELAHMEERCEYSEIWLVSYDLTEEINDGIYAGVVAKNVRRGGCRTKKSEAASF